MLKITCSSYSSFFLPFMASAQRDASNDRDTFSCQRKRVTGKLGRSITRNNYPDEQPAKVSPHMKITGAWSFMRSK